MNLDDPSLCNCIKQPLNPMCLVKIHGEEMPGDVESMGAEGGVADMDEIEEIQQLTQLLGVEQATGDDGNVNDSSSDEENDGDKDSGGDKDCGGDTLYPEKFVVVGSWQEQRYQCNHV